MRAAALGMAGAVLALHAGTAAACIPADAASCPQGQQKLPVPHLTEDTGIPLTAEEGDKQASDSPEQESVLQRWDIDTDRLPPEEDDQIPTVPEEIREYFEEAVADTVEKYDGSTPPASDMSRYSLRSDAIRAEVRAKAHRLMKKESGRILDRMNSFALSFGGPAIAKMAADMQSRTAGKMTAFGKGQEDENRDQSAGSAGLFPSSPESSTSSPSAGKPSNEKSSEGISYGRVPFLSIVPPLKEESADPDAGLNEDSRDNYKDSVSADISQTSSTEDEGRENQSKEAGESPAENDISSGGNYDPGNDFISPPPGMYSFLSYLPGGSLLADQESLSSRQDLSDSYSIEEDSSESFSSEEPSSEGYSSEEYSADKDSADEDSADGNSADGDFADEDSADEDSVDENSPNIFSDSFSDDEDSGFGDNEIFPDLTANFALARPLTSGRLYYKYAGKNSRSSAGEPEEKDDTGYDQDSLSEEISPADSAARRNVVFIGDSRTVGMEMYVGGREDEYWCARNSMGYSWMVNTAAPSVDDLIGENTDVVILMGVNDLGNVNLYVDYMNQKAAEWKDRGARTFFVSVTPVVDSKSPNAKNSRIESFNAYAIENLRNVHYIDAYNRIRYSFGSPDGIHFDAATYREIYRIIHFYLYQGWYEEAGLRFYFDCGQPLTGWHCLDGAWQYMDGAGVRWVSNSRVGDVCLAPYPMTGLTDPDAGVLTSMDPDTSGLQ